MDTLPYMSPLMAAHFCRDGTEVESLGSDVVEWARFPAPPFRSLHDSEKPPYCGVLHTYAYSANTTPRSERHFN